MHVAQEQEVTEERSFCVTVCFFKLCRLFLLTHWFQQSPLGLSCLTLADYHCTLSCWFYQMIGRGDTFLLSGLDHVFSDFCSAVGHFPTVLCDEEFRKTSVLDQTNLREASRGFLQAMCGFSECASSKRTFPILNVRQDLSNLPTKINQLHWSQNYLPHSEASK